MRIVEKLEYFLIPKLINYIVSTEYNTIYDIHSKNGTGSRLRRHYYYFRGRLADSGTLTNKTSHYSSMMFPYLNEPWVLASENWALNASGSRIIISVLNNNNNNK